MTSWHILQKWDGRLWAAICEGGGEGRAVVNTVMNFQVAWNAGN
jgi:hypothetical protein